MRVCRRPPSAAPRGLRLAAVREEPGAREHEVRAVGVGPWAGDLPVGSQWDAALLSGGDRRNVADRYRYWTQEAIVADLDSHRHAFHVAVENWGHDFNIGSVVRTANAFNAKAIHIVGRRRWNRRGAMVTDRYQHEIHHPDVANLVRWASRQVPGSAVGQIGGRPGGDGHGDPAGDGHADPAGDGHGDPAGGGAGHGIPLIGVDNLPGSRPLETYDLPRECVLVLGQEGPGLSEPMLEACAVVLDIAQFGSTRSLNAGAAAAVAMHAWIRRHVFSQAPAPVEGPRTRP